eukprot:1192518-Prorocentrum_minimum.AAC.7
MLRCAAVSGARAEGGGGVGAPAVHRPRGEQRGGGGRGGQRRGGRSGARGGGVARVGAQPAVACAGGGQDGGHPARAAARAAAARGGARAGVPRQVRRLAAGACRTTPPGDLTPPRSAARFPPLGHGSDSLKHRYGPPRAYTIDPYVPPPQRPYTSRAVNLYLCVLRNTLCLRQ